jgi:hypothetical protein
MLPAVRAWIEHASAAFSADFGWPRTHDSEPEQHIEESHAHRTRR